MPRLAPLFLLLTLASPLARAGDSIPRPGTMRFTQETAVQSALAKNFSIEVERFQPRIASERVTGALGRFDPVFDVSIAREETTTRDIFDTGLHLPTRIRRTQDRFSTGLSGATPLGLSYDLGLGTRNVFGTENFGDNFETTASLSVRQSLLRDFGPTANLAQVRIARANLLASEWELKQRIIDIITETDFVYQELHLAQENLRVAERSRELAGQLLRDNQARVEIGVKSPLDVTEARAQVAAREEGVILAQRTSLDNENLLKQLVTNDLERILDVRVEIASPRSPSFAADVPAGIRDALALRPDYRQAILEIERRHITLAFTRNQALPRFDLTGSLAALGFGGDLGASVSRIGERDQGVWSIGAIVSIPIFNRERRSEASAAALEAAKSLVALQQLEQKIVVDVDNASGQIVTSRQRIAATTEASRLAQESLDAGEDRLRAGAGTTFEVLDLQEKLAEAEFAELRARADYNKAVSEYQRQTGTALAKNRVVLE